VADRVKRWLIRVGGDRGFTVVFSINLFSIS